MQAKDVAIELGGVRFELCAERAAFRPDRREVLIADVHLGKAATFRRAGRPIPRGTTARELERIDALLRRTRAERLAILGDLFHGDVEEGSPTAERTREWLEARAATLEIVLVRGNHDRHARALIESLPLRVESEPWQPDEGPAYRHHPTGEAPWIAGHLHPGARLCDGTDSLKLPVFWGRSDGLVLPAFGEFTGLFSIAPERGDRVAAVTPTGVVPLPDGLVVRD